MTEAGAQKMLRSLPKAYQINEHDAKKICACLNLFHARLLEGLRESGNLRKEV